MYVLLVVFPVVLFFFSFVDFVPIFFIKRKMVWSWIGGEVRNNWEGWEIKLLAKKILHKI